MTLDLTFTGWVKKFNQKPDTEWLRRQQEKISFLIILVVKGRRQARTLEKEQRELRESTFGW